MSNFDPTNTTDLALLATEIKRWIHARENVSKKRAADGKSILGVWVLEDALKAINCLGEKLDKEVGLIS